MHAHLLSWIIFLPTIGMVLVLLMPRPGAARYVSLAATVATFFVSLLLFEGFVGPDELASFGSRYGLLHFVERSDWITAGDFKIEYYLGVDGLSFPLVILTTLISMLACLASWNIAKAVRAYHALFLLLETGMLGVFLALDFFLFYIFWEVMLLPMYFLIGVWGAPSRREAGAIRGGPYAAIKFFLYTLLGSILMLVVMLAFYFKSAEVLGGAGTFDLIALATNEQIQQVFNDPAELFLGFRFGLVMFVFLYVAFAIKLPVFPFHTWLPDAHVEAPTPISMILAGILLKMGAYGLFRISLPILPRYTEAAAVALAVFGLINIIYGALCAMAQTDFKKLVAYSSISHMGYVLLGLAAMTQAGFDGAMFQVLAHGISSPMCFFLVGVIYDRVHHRQINRFGGLWLTMPV
ncbi:MAG: NuoM family protein, partial [Phycisphaerae bacterium]